MKTQPTFPTVQSNANYRHSIAAIGLAALVIAACLLMGCKKKATISLIGKVDVECFGMTQSGSLLLTGHGDSFSIHSIMAPNAPSHIMTMKLDEIIKSPKDGEMISHVHFADPIAYVAGGAAGLILIDLTDLEAPVVQATIDTDGKAWDVDVSGDFAYVSDFDKGLKIYDVSQPAGSKLVGSLPTPNQSQSLKVVGTMAYQNDTYAGLRCIDVSDPANPVLLGVCDTPGYTGGLAIVGTTAYVADDESGLAIIDISQPAAPKLRASCDTPGAAVDVAVHDNLAYVADFDHGVQIIDVSNPDAPYLCGAFPEADISQRIEINAPNIYVGGPGAVGVFRIP